MLQRARFESTARFLLECVRHESPQDLIPRNEEWLREVVFVPVELMVDIMIRSVVPEEEVKYVSWQPEAAVVVDSLHGREGEEEDGRPRRHAGGHERECAAHGVQQKALDRVVVLAAEGVGDDEAVVPGVDVAVQKLVDVHVPMPKVLPCIDHKHPDKELLCNHNGRSPLTTSARRISGAIGHLEHKECYNGLYQLLQENTSSNLPL